MHDSDSFLAETEPQQFALMLAATGQRLARAKLRIQLWQTPIASVQTPAKQDHKLKRIASLATPSVSCDAAIVLKSQLQTVMPMLRRVASAATVSLALLGSIAYASLAPTDDRLGRPSHGSSEVEPNGTNVDSRASSQAYDQTPRPAALPNGANALKETYGDWATECRIIESKRTCAIGQLHYDQQKRIIFSIEFLSSDAGGYRVEILTPFGLNLSSGIRLKLDDQANEHHGSFATCLAYGCLTLMSFSEVSIETMKTAKALKVIATPYGSDQTAIFGVSLNGFSAAIERLRELQ